MAEILSLPVLSSTQGLPDVAVEMLNGQPRVPEWMKAKTGKARQSAETGDLLHGLSITTVCEEARCPNIGECWSQKAATFMIGGDKCTRACAFCNVATARPDDLDPFEPARVALAAKKLGLKYVVITSVDRDDLQDGGAAHWVRTIESVRRELPGSKIEILTPDFKGNWDNLYTVAATRPDVYNHNIETVPRLYSTARRGSKYERSLELLKRVKEFDANIKVKSGLMVGLGEEKHEILQVLADLRAHGVDFVTMGQYLRPTPKHLALQRYYHPDEFAELKREAQKMGFSMVASGPFVRSSFHAGEDYDAMTEAL
jgi:lipoic acid synthetase